MFTRPYTSEQLARGEGMIYHPVTGEELRSLQYVDWKHAFCRLISAGAWDWDPDIEPVESISNGRAYAYGDQFPAHWNFHLQTGEELACRN